MPAVWPGIAAKVMVWATGVTTVITWPTVAAAAFVLLPAWLALMPQEPVVAKVTTLPETVQTPLATAAATNGSN